MPAMATEEDIFGAIAKLNKLGAGVDRERRGERRPRRCRRRDQGPARVHRRGADRQAGQLGDRPGGRRRRLRHPLRAAGQGAARALPHRRRAARDHGGAAAHAAGRHLAPQDHGRARHRRAPRAAGRPHRPRSSAASRSTCASRRCRRVYGEKIVMRLLDKSNVMIDLEDLGFSDKALKRFKRSFTRPYGAILVTGPDRLGQVDHALRGAQQAQLGREEHHHGRGPGRVPARRHQPGPGQQQGRPDLRRRPALDPALRPRHHHGRRDPRPRDGADRDRGGAHRPPRALARCTPTTRPARSRG